MLPITPFDIDLYERRIAEWDRLSAGVKSSTLRDSFLQAKSASDRAMELFIEPQRMTIVIMSTNKISFEKSMAQYTAHLRQVTEEVDKANSLGIPLPGMADYFSDLINQVKNQANKEKAVYDLSSEVYSLAIDQFKAVLLLIYQPNDGSFHYESIVDGIQYFIDKLLPGLSELRSIKNWAPAIRRKTFAEKGDKLLLYVEQYLDAISKWEELAGSYIRLLVE